MSLRFVPPEPLQEHGFTEAGTRDPGTGHTRAAMDGAWLNSPPYKLNHGRRE
jgi:hypothetical protein